MTKSKYIKEFGYEILEADEANLRLTMYVLYFMEVYLSQSELPGYMWTKLNRMKAEKHYIKILEQILNEIENNESNGFYFDFNEEDNNFVI